MRFAEAEGMSMGADNGQLKAPFVWFGGKSSVVDLVWARLGRVDTYIEPFFGSGAMLLANPHWESCVETVNDLDHFVCNAWRSIIAAPDEVAKWADYPVIETDLHIRHVWLVNEGRERIKACEWDVEHFDAKVAGWWLWGMANWIGGQFCAGNGCWTAEMLQAAAELGTYDAAEIQRRRPHLGDAGNGVHRRRPHLGGGGKGVQRRLPHLGDGQGDGIFPRNHGLIEYLQALANRLRNVRVCCGDWERICQPAVTWAGEEGTHKCTCGVFLDPPYSAEAGRAMSIYARDCGEVARYVREWCKINGANKLMRIALCGYTGEGHEELESLGWTTETWSAPGGYAAVAENGRGMQNRHRETIWFSPSCKQEATLFDFTAAAAPE